MITKKIDFPSVTLVCADCTPRFSNAICAIKRCKQYIDFGDEKIFSSCESDYPGIIKICGIKSKAEYSWFILSELYKYIDTEHMLIVQHDGYVINANMWRPEWLQYDYIGAPMWIPELKKYVVGNGGFSLRSTRLMRHVATTSGYANSPNEDRIICQHRPELRKQFLFAPLDVASKFAYLNKPTKLSTFGFHGYPKIVKKKGKK